MKAGPESGRAPMDSGRSLSSPNWAYAGDGSEMDFGSVLGIVIGFGLILFANKMEGGQIGSLLQLTAFMIVGGGTLGAVMLQFPLSKLMLAAKGGLQVFLRKKKDPNAAIAQIVEYAKRVRREGILALEKEIPNIKDAFFAKALRMAVDGLEPKTLLETMETEIATLEGDHEFQMKVWEAAGGYVPTVGILGAVLGLIHVMAHLDDPSKLGGGIATAFVATVYGVGFANLVFLPFSNKIKTNGKDSMMLCEIQLRGVLLIQEGVNHSIIEEQLKSYLDAKMKKKYESQHAGKGD